MAEFKCINTLFSDIFANVIQSKFLLIEDLFGRVWESSSWMVRKLLYPTRDEIPYLLGLVLLSLVLFLVEVRYIKCGKTKGQYAETNAVLKKYLLDVHRIAGSLKTSKDEIKYCIKILNQFPSFINHVSPPQGFTPFLRACWSGNTPLIRYMLLNGADIQACSVTKESAIYLAAYRVIKNKHWNPSVLNLLVKAGCPLSISTVKGFTALHYAARAGDVTLTKWLLMHGAHLTLPSTKFSPYDIAGCFQDANHQSIAVLLHIYCPEMAGKGKQNYLIPKAPLLEKHSNEL